MELILWRHAEAKDGVPDHERALTSKGQKQAKRIAKWLTKRLPDAYRVLVSPARRAQQTAAALTKNFETVDKLAVGATASAVLEAAGWGESDGALVIVVGHQPTLGDAAMRALSGRSGTLAIKKGALLWLRTSQGTDGVSVRAAIAPDLV